MEQEQEQDLCEGVPGEPVYESGLADPRVPDSDYGDPRGPGDSTPQSTGHRRGGGDWRLGEGGAGGCRPLGHSTSHFTSGDLTSVSLDWCLTVIGCHCD